jgi:hypothetical protein
MVLRPGPGRYDEAHSFGADGRPPLRPPAYRGVALT